MPNPYEKQVRENVYEERWNVAHDDVIAFEFIWIAFVSFTTQHFAVDKHAVTIFHILDENLGQC